WAWRPASCPRIRARRARTRRRASSPTRPSSWDLRGPKGSTSPAGWRWSRARPGAPRHAPSPRAGSRPGRAWAPSCRLRDVQTLVELIAEKRDGRHHTEAQIERLIDAFGRGELADYQMSAWLMAVFFRGMDDAETVALTRAMLRSGD